MNPASLLRLSWILLVSQLLFPLHAQNKEMTLVDLGAFEANRLTNGPSVAVLPGPQASLQVTLTSNGESTLVFSSGAGPWNLQAWRYVAVALENNGSENIVPEVRVKAGKAWDGWGEYAQGHAVLKPGETKTVLVPVWDSEFTKRFPYAAKYYPGMTILPETWEFCMWRVLPSKAVNALRLSLLNLNKSKSYRYKVLSVRAVLPLQFPAEEELQGGIFFPFMDRWGQYKRRDWPGKIKADADFAKSLAEEKTVLEGCPWPSAWNKFGGMEAGPTLRATGHFRVEKVEGRWWFVDPAGKLFWSKGATGVGPTLAATTLSHEQKLRYFEAPPGVLDPATSPFMAFNERSKKWSYQVGAANLFLKFGPGWQDKAMAHTLQRFPAYGMNTLGAWSEAVAAQRAPGYKGGKIPYTVILHLWSTPLDGNMPDAFDPGFENSIEPNFKKAAQEGHDADPWCLGLFIDNELQFPSAAQLGKIVLAAPKTLAARKKFAALLKEKYGTVEALNQAWAGKFESWKTVEEAPVRDWKPNEESLEFLRIFNGLLGDAYHGTVRKVFKKYFPNKLYLGSRMNRNVAEHIQSASRHCDVVSFNKYELGLRGFRLPAGSVDAPVIVGEFCFVRGGRTHDSSSLGEYLDPDYRPRAYADYIVGCLGNPALVGAHWFQWSSQPISGRGDGENYEQGFIDSTDTPYLNLAMASRRLSMEMYEIRLHQKEFQYDF